MGGLLLPFLEIYFFVLQLRTVPQTYCMQVVATQLYCCISGELVLVDLVVDHG